MAIESEKPGTRRDIIQSVSRALDVLLDLAQDGGISSIASISDHTDIPRPTVFRLLQTLAAKGFVIKTARGEYSVGAAFFTLTSAAGQSLGAALQESLRRLSATTGESSSMAMYDDGTALYIAHQSSSQSMRQFTRAGNRVSLHSAGVGKVLLSEMNADERGRIIKSINLVPLTSNTMTSPEALASECDHIREVGYGVDNEEHEIGVKCVAMSVPGFPLFALSVSGPPSRMTELRIRDVTLPALKESVKRVAEALSGSS